MKNAGDQKSLFDILVAENTNMLPEFLPLDMALVTQHDDGLATATTFTPTDVASVIGHFEGKPSPLYNPFYYETSTTTINFGYGSNLTAAENGALHGNSVLKDDYTSWLSHEGVTLTDAQWLSFSTHSLAENKNGDSIAATLNASLPSQDWTAAASYLADNYVNTIVVPEVEKNIPGLLSLPMLTQIAIENVDYDNSTLLGPLIYSAANSSDLIGIAEQLGFNAEAAHSNQSGLEERFLTSALLAIQVVPTLNQANVVTSVNSSAAATSDVVGFLDDVLSKNTLGHGGVSASAYVKAWGSGPFKSYGNIVSGLDSYAATKGFYVASTTSDVPSINSASVSFTGPAFSLYNAPFYTGVISGFAPGDSLDLADVPSITAASIGTGNVINVTEGDGKTFQLKLNPSQNLSGMSLSTQSDGFGGSDITLNGSMQVDYSFVIDTTGSMAPYLAGVQGDADALIKAIFNNNQTDAHINVVSFKDPQAGYPDSVVLPFTTQPTYSDREQAAVSAIDTLSADGGGDIPEGDYSGLLLALNGSAGEWRQSASIRNVVLFTDAPVKDSYLEATVNQYAQNLGVDVEGHSTTVIAEKGQVSTFLFSGSADAQPFSARIYVIQVGTDPTATESLQQIVTGAGTGGAFFQSPTPADLVATLTQIIGQIQISGTVANQTTNDVMPINLFASASVVDPTSGQTETLTIVPSSNFNGTFSNLDGGTVDPATGIYTITGTSSDVTNALQGLVFTPTPHQVAPGETVTTRFTITDTDTAGTTATDTVTSVVVTDTAPCFASGTRILTTSGEVTVERLVVGDTVLTHFGETAPILWLGHRTVDCQRHAHPQDVWPVRITAGAFGAGKPVRDLLLSPDHAVFHDGVLTPIRYLINHATIVQERRKEVSYWHVELKNHNVLNAEGLACETYLDNGNRHAFSNCDSATQLHPYFTAGDGCQAIWESVACAPMRITGSAVAKLVMRLDRRAKKLGHAVSHRPTRQAIHENAATVNLSGLLQPNWYRATHTDVASADFDVGTHYAHWGWREGRLPCPESDLIRALGLIDSASLMFTMADVVMAGADPVAHFCSLGWREGRNPNPYFDTKWYLANNAVPYGMNPLLHYVLSGERQGFTPGPHFDPTWYRRHYQLDAPVCGLAHYLLNRRTGLFSPLPSFNVEAYVREHTATLLQNRDPYAHHLAFGRSAPETNIEFSRLAA